MRTHYLTAVSPAINHWFGVAVVDTGDKFSINYIFVTFFMSRAYSKFNNFFNFVFHCPKTKLRI